MTTKITLQDSIRARARIAGRIRETPLVESPSLSSLSGRQVLLKLESRQITGSFKLRGATNAVLSLTDTQRAAGVVGVSTGNHGRGLAYAAAEAEVRCIICMSELVPQNKVDGIRSHGAEVRILGRSQDDAQQEVDRLVRDGMTMLPPFDHPDIIAGQGTVALEMLDQAPDLETVLVPLSGGGLISGVGMVLKAANPDIRVIGVSMERGAAMYECLQAGRPVQVAELPTLADSLGGGIGLDNAYTFEMTKAFVDEVVLVSEAEIAAAIRHAYFEEREVIEGSGSVGIAALLAGKIGNPGRCVSLVSGQNIAMDLHKRIIDGEDVDVEADIKGGADA
ncbi:hydroxyectoine utilization dehydratase EutB [Ruegeria pomeroyi]|uniref:Threonine dehydratase, putative n=2 Tax=Ruegeria pomeroyi TaxID=89184 RepID=Q5LUB2_RUEPO|nr:hydroxyectoine utilization dehydratase EutB [Ruegeria pomeroyi]HCE70783.1 hydroxyectoine utilization dehydratase EutB [Ruegeria sp.]AAV94442.1 hydroxyectoine utilization dehydratase [Ruegeria pomeroyi DSS-3]NVK99444.1 hydroxyectoine utilization dehydratase EutB [Ruegeria pomeroyi]NVL03308.1 hydroxyectoine utilization dehydratase EutB [Ruegeria pomeroyi]QWV08024.1 hydroxyectoine utilization dehydratase EutB [Ruegeria pomeroyi]